MECEAGVDNVDNGCDLGKCLKQTLEAYHESAGEGNIKEARILGGPPLLMAALHARKE